MTVLIYVSVFILSVIVSLFLRKTIFSPIVLFSLTWCVFPAISTFGLIGLYEPSTKTHVFILLSVFSFYWSYFLIKINDQKRNLNLEQFSIQNSNYNDYINYKLIVFVNIIILIILIPSTITSFQTAQTYGYAYLREIGTDALTTNTALSILYELIAIPIMLSSACLIIAEQLSKKNKKNIQVLFLILLNIILHSIVFAARALIVKIIFYILFGVFFCKKNRRKIKLSFSQQFLIFISVFGLLAFTSYLTAERNIGSVSSLTFIDSIIWYYIGPFSLFDLYINYPELSYLDPNTPLFFGKVTFGFIYNLIPTMLSAILGIEYVGTDYMLSLFTRIFMEVGDGIYMNSATTAMYPFLRDFGIFGLIIGFSFIGAAIAKAESNSINKNSMRSNAIYIYLLYVLFKTSMNYEPISPAITFAIIFILIFTYKRKMIKTKGIRLVLPFCKRK